MRWTRQRSTCACRYSLGQTSAPPRRQSKPIPLSICAAPSPFSYTSRTAKCTNVNILDLIRWPAGSIVVIDRGYLDFGRLQALHQGQVSFVIRAKDNTRYTLSASREVDKSTGLRSDQTILLATPKSKRAYPDRLRRISFRDPETNKYLVFLTNRFDLPALTITEIYRKRWCVETFFKWIKQNLSVKHFFGNSINAVKSQIWIAVCVYLVVTIARKRLNLPASPQLLLNIFEVNMFEKIPLDQLVTDALLYFDEHPACNQLTLF